ncbi:hypothetical protein ACYSNO_10955 [Enterococcus sp. LJL98]
MKMLGLKYNRSYLFGRLLAILEKTIQLLQAYDEAGDVFFLSNEQKFWVEYQRKPASIM